MSKSLYADRETVGTLALKAQQCQDIPIVGDLGHDLINSLVEDLNDTIKSDPYKGKPFYIIIHEKKDLQLKNVILRRMITSRKRPYPEPNTTVFFTSPRRDKTLFCWSLPHQSSFLGYILNKDDYNTQQISDIEAYQAENREYFGFKWVGNDKKGTPLIKAIPGFKDRPLKGQESFNVRV